MKTIKNISIAKKLTISLVFVTVILTVIFIIMYSLLIDRRENLRLEQGADNMIDSIVSTLEVPLWDMDYENASAICSFYHNNNQVQSLELIDESGKVIFAQTHEGTNGVSHLSRFSEIFYQGEYLGKVNLSFNSQPVKAARDQLLKTSIFALFICILALIIFTGLLLKKVLKSPLNFLKDIAEAYAKGNYRPEIGTVSYKEFEPLVSILVDMGNTVEKQVQELREAEEDLRAHRDNLEEMVRDRTKQLEDSNKELRKEVKNRKDAEENLKKNQQTMNAIIMASPIGIGLIVKRKFFWINEAAQELFGYEKTEIIGRDARMFYCSDEEYVRVGNLFYGNITNDTVSSTESQLVKKDGTIIDCLLRVCPLESDLVEDGYIVAVIDISREKALEAKLQMAEKMEAIGTLAGGVAHDLNNILSGIVSYPDLLLLDLPTDSSLRIPLETIKKSGDRAVEIVQDLLTMARRGVASTEIVNLNALIVEQLRSPEMEKLKQLHPLIDITTDLSDFLFNVKCSPVHISKSVMNLLNNAAEAMPDGGTLTISTTDVYLDTPVSGYEDIDEGDYVKLTVEDTGIGISEDDIDKIFEPFYTKKKMGRRSGSGLGMAVVWGTIKDHNGYIDVKSSLDKGSIFDIYLPVTREESSSSSSTVPLQDIMGKGESILVVDDVAEQREVATGMLERLGYMVDSVASGEEAVEYVRFKKPDLIVLDMIMDPGIDGLETYQQISGLHPDQKAIIASGFSQTERVRQLQTLGAGKYVKKPYSLGKIGQAVKRELEKDILF